MDTFTIGRDDKGRCSLERTNSYGDLQRVVDDVTPLQVVQQLCELLGFSYPNRASQETPPAPDCIGCEIARQELERMKVARQCGTCGKIHRALQL